MEAQTLASLIERLDHAAERGTLLAVLSDFKKAFSSAEKWQCEHMAKAVLSCQSKFHNFLTTSEVDSYFAEYLSLMAISSRIRVLYFLFCDGFTDLYSYLLTSLDSKNLEAVMLASIAKKDEDDEFIDVITCLASVPDKISNFSEKCASTDKVILHDWSRNYPHNIYIALSRTLDTVNTKIKDGEDVNLRAVSLLLIKARHFPVWNSTLLDCLVQWICQREDSPIWDRIAQRIFTDNSHGIREYEAMLIAIFHATKTKKDVMRCLGYQLKKDGCISSIIRRLILQRTCSSHVPHVLAEYTAEAGGNQSFTKLFNEIITVWSNASFIKFNPVEKQRYLTLCLLEFGKKVNELNLNNMWDQLSVTILTGVHQRLSDADPTIRQSGLFVGEMCSKWKGDNEALTFEYEEDDWLKEMRRVVENKNSVEYQEEEPQPSTSYIETDISNLKIKTNQKEIDSDDEIEFETDFIPEEERNFEKLKEGEDPEKSHQPPNYIGDAMEWLMEKERYEKFEAGLFTLEAMIRRRAIGFNDIAPKLIIRLVHLENRFGTKNFEQIRKNCITACLVMRPDLAPSFGDVLFSRSCNFNTRYLILNCFLEAAKELSEPPKKDPPVKEVKKSGNFDTNDWRSVVDARIKAKTRIISVKKPEPATNINRFANVATLFFYPLLKTKTEEHLELQGRDAVFLAKILVVASEILQCGAASSNIIKMASSLATLTWPLRFHEEASLRIAVMFSYFSIVSAVPTRIFFEVFTKEVSSWLEWICAVAENVDLGEQERTLARHVATVLLENARVAEENSNKG